jgi:chromosome segregation ATPase
MSDEPLTRAVLASVLADFHRDVVRPDIQHIVAEEVGTLRREMFDHFDGVHHQLEQLDHESVALKAGLRRVEERLTVVEERLAIMEVRLGSLDERAERQEGRLDNLESMVLELRTRLGRVEERLEELIAVEEKYPLRVEVQDLKAKVERLHEDLRRLEQRMKPSAKG